MPEPNVTHDVAVIGGGIVGLSAALECQRRGLAVALVDPGDPRGRASFGNAGVISRGSILAVANPAVWGDLIRFGLNRDRGLRLRHGALPAQLPWFLVFLAHCSERAWRRSAAAIDPLIAASHDRHVDFAARTGASALIERKGWFKLYRDEASFRKAALERAIQRQHRIQVEELAPEDIARMEPGMIRRFARGCWYPETGSVTDPGALVARYEAAFRQNDGAVVPGMAADIRREGQGLIITGPGLVARARTVVIAAGARSAPLAAAFGCRVPLTAERGYHRHFAPAPGHALGRPVYDAGGAFVLAPIGGDIRVLTGVELARPDDPPDYTQLEAACAAAPATLPLGPEKAGSTWMGSRPSTPDGLPVIGFAPGARDIVFAYGHGHVGLSLGPVTGEIVADLVTGQTPRFDLAPFSPSRFA